MPLCDKTWWARVERRWLDDGLVAVYDGPDYLLLFWLVAR